MPCLGCGIEGWSNACHPNQAKYGKGKSIKAGDLYCFPLCAPHFGRPVCHFEHDQCIDMSKAERDAEEDDYIRRTQALAVAAGRREFMVAA